MENMSVKRAAENLEPVKKYIERCWHSHKREHVFCLVEGTFDKHVYETRLNNTCIEVKIAADDKLSHNRNSVQYLVEDLYKLHPNGRFIGIRDKDYMTILGLQCPPHIYTTDKRDLEMMIFSSTSFCSSDENIPAYLEEVLPHCQNMAYIRIYAENKGLCNKVNDKMSITSIYNQKERQFVEDSKAELVKAYLEKVDTSSQREDIDKYIKGNKLEDYSPYDICRGHDVVGLMGFVYGKEYEQRSIEEKMEQHYRKENFYSTMLFNEIQGYCKPFGIEAKSPVFPKTENDD